MPELPDLQVFSQNLHKALNGLKLTKLVVAQSKKLNVPAAELIQALQGKVLQEVVRSGKQLHFNFAHHQTLAIHLMLHGQIHWLEEEKPIKYPIIELHFDGGKSIAVTDFQKAVIPTLNPVPSKAPDALDDEVDFEFWKDKFKGSRAAVKKLLMDQDVVRGIGNAYADEILYDAGISPFSIAGQIPEQDVRTLTHSIKHVLTDATKQIKKTNPGIIYGEVRDFLKVHQPKQKETPQGEVILMKTLSSRKTYYTASQKLFD